MVLKTAPNEVGALNNLALLLQAQGRVKDALAVSARAYETARDIPAVGDTHGWLLVAAGRATEAASILSAAVRRAPALAQARITWARRWHSLGVMRRLSTRCARRCQEGWRLTLTRLPNFSRAYGGTSTHWVSTAPCWSSLG